MHKGGRCAPDGSTLPNDGHCQQRAKRPLSDGGSQAEIKVADFC